MRMRWVSWAVLPLLLWGCATPQDLVAAKENQLSAAGFVPRPANTPARQAMLRNLPPNQILQRAQGDRFTYIYSDPLDCVCVYFGNQAAYGRYRSLVAQRQIANDQVLAAQLYSEPGWDWGPWGPFGWY